MLRERSNLSIRCRLMYSRAGSAMIKGALSRICAGRWIAEGAISRPSPSIQKSSHYSAPVTRPRSLSAMRICLRPDYQCDYRLHILFPTPLEKVVVARTRDEESVLLRGAGAGVECPSLSHWYDLIIFAMDDQSRNVYFRYFHVVTETHHALNILEQVCNAQPCKLFSLARKAALYD